MSMLPPKKTLPPRINLELRTGVSDHMRGGSQYQGKLLTSRVKSERLASHCAFNVLMNQYQIGDGQLREKRSPAPAQPRWCHQEAL